MAEAEFDTILAELVAASSQDKSLLQFRTLVSAHQYLGLYRLVVQTVKRGSAVLDWGAGNGHFSYFLVRAGYRVSGFEFADRPAICGVFPPEVYTYQKGELSNPTALPFEGQVFNAVASVGVLEHVRETGGNEIASLTEINRTLKPGGVFICFHLPNRYSWIEAALRLSGRWSHRYRYTAAGIRSLGAATGFEIVEMRRYAILPRNIFWWGLPGWLGSARRLARWYDRLDDFLSVVLSPVCQNYLVVARKRA